MRKFMIGLGVAALLLGSGRLAFAASFLPHGDDPATALLLASGLFTVAFAAVVRN